MRITLLLLFVTISFPSLSQQSIRVGELENQRKKVLEEIEMTDKLLQENKKTTSNALNRLSLLTQQIQSRKEVISILNKELRVLEEEIQFKEMQVRDLERALQQKKEYFAASVRKMYAQKNNRDFLLFILSAKDFYQSYRRALYLKEYSNWRKDQAGEIVKKQEIVNREKELLVKTRNDKNILLKERQKEELQLVQEESTHKSEVESLKKNQKQLLAELERKRREANTLNKEIERIIAEEVANAQKKMAGGEKRVAESKGGYAMTKDEKNLASGFAGNKGRLPFPLKGNYRIVGKFGVQQHREVKSVVVTNNGIDLETTPGNEARAVFDGTVTRVFSVPGSNSSIIVRHGNYLTLYSNIDQVYSKQGDKVNTGQALGKIYTDPERGNSTVLHFELWKDNTKLDPSPWLNSK